MEIENLRFTEHHHITPKGFTQLGKFTVKVSEDLKIYEMQLLQAPDGKYVVVPPQHPNGAPMCTMSPAMRKEIALLASQAIIGSYAEKASDWFNTNYFNHPSNQREKAR